MGKKILLMYISEHSGHHQASIALEKAILKKDHSCEVLNINALRYTNPVTEKIIHGIYMKVVKNRPEIWGYLYDNPHLVKKTRRIRSAVNAKGSKKIERLFDGFTPDVIACTQAFPCGLVAEYKRKNASRVPLVGILTDYAPHAYWIYDEVNAYVVPSREIKEAFIKKGVPKRKIKVFGTPIDPVFEAPVNKALVYKKTGLSPRLPFILVMGGTHGLGPGERLVKALEASKKDLQAVVVTGVNKKLLKKIKRATPSLEKNIIGMGFVDNVHELMSIADIIITKPGGLTTAEALAKSLPMIILKPLPGQEELNARTLVSKGASIRADNEKSAVRIVEELLSGPEKIINMRQAMAANAKPRAAIDTAKLILKLAG